MENEFDEAIRNEEFVVYLQPKYNVVTEEIAGAEHLYDGRKKMALWYLQVNLFHFMRRMD